MALVLKCADQVLVCNLNRLAIDTEIKTTGQVADTAIHGAAASIAIRRSVDICAYLGGKTLWQQDLAGSAIQRRHETAIRNGVGIRGL